MQRHCRGSCQSLELTGCNHATQDGRKGGAAHCVGRFAADRQTGRCLHVMHRELCCTDFALAQSEDPLAAQCVGHSSSLDHRPHNMSHPIICVS